MPESRNRPGHHYQQKADIPARQRVKGRVLWAILCAIFAVLIAVFAAGDNYLVLIIAAVAGGVIGYIAGKSMEKDAKKGE